MNSASTTIGDKSESTSSDVEMPESSAANKLSVEWSIAAIPILAWVFAYAYELGLYDAAEVPRALFDMSFVRMLNGAVLASFFVIAPFIGAMDIFQKMVNRSWWLLAAFFVVTVVAVATGKFLFEASGSRGSTLLGQVLLFGLIFAGILARRSLKQGGIVARLWRSPPARITAVFMFCTLGFMISERLGYYAREHRISYSVLRSDCGPLVEVFRISGDSIVLLVHGPKGRGAEIRSISSSGALQIRGAGRHEVAYRAEFVGPCPSWTMPVSR